MSCVKGLRRLAIASVVLLGGALSVLSPIGRAQSPDVANAGQSAPVDTPPADESIVEPHGEARLMSPRQAIRTFVLAMENGDYSVAVSALDFSSTDPPLNPYQQVTRAQHLKSCMDRLAIVDEEQFSDENEGLPVLFPPDHPDSSIVLQRGRDGRWRFSAATVSGIEALYALIKDNPVLGDVVSTPVERAADDNGVDEASTADVVEAVDVPDGLRSARQTMRTLFNSLKVRDSSSAVATMDFSLVESQQSTPTFGPYTKLEYANRLKDVLDRMALIDYSKISDDPDGAPFYFPPDTVNPPIVISRGESGVWQFSAETVRDIEDLHALFKDRPVVNLADALRPWYDRELILGNEVWRILALFAAIFVSLLLGQCIRMAARWHASRLEQRGRIVRAVVVRTIAKTIVAIAFLVGLRAGVKALVLGHSVESFASTTISVVFTLVIGYICFRLVDVAVEFLRDLARRTGSSLNDMLVPIVSASLRLTIIVVIALEIATVVSDQPPSAILAGLGAGGLAIGLAGQDTLKNFFGSLMIYADRPFELGDRIVVDGYDGPVESVGFRSTRIRTLEGHLVTVPNGEMAHRSILNIGKRPHIRRVFAVHLPYDSSPPVVQRALDLLRDILSDHEGMQGDYPPRVFLDKFLDAAIRIRVFYWYHPPSYWDFCEFNERVNLAILERFREEGIRFSLPAQRLFLATDESLSAQTDPS